MGQFSISEVGHFYIAANNREEFKEKQMAIQNAVQMQLAGFRIFVTDIQELRVLERLEAAIMNKLYEQAPPICDIPDRGMQLAPRWNSENPITVKSCCKVHLHGLPDFLVI